MTELIIAQEHSQLYDLWIQNGEKDLSICHVDFHDDMRGLLINRKYGTAQFVSRHIPYIHMRDPGSFLSHAIMEGIVTKLRWVHDEHGGREYDSPVVKYESDLTAMPYLLLPAKKVKIQFSEHTFKDWGGVQSGEHLDIDWDGIAFPDYDLPHIRALMSEILDRNYPADMPRVYLVLSPDYCHPDMKLFDEFLHLLEKKFNTTAKHLPKYQPVPEISKFWMLYRKIDTRAERLIRKFRFY
ncbi:MAG: hypothetical protein KF758_18080 [Anaerolineales bacterium]|nr:hypothetical protein [Anaerolineales bacterium]MBX3038824.1 hypothetical protein [Anaerolineales bacterium]